MTICDICGRSVHRRSRLADGRMICWNCSFFIKRGLDEALREIKKIQEKSYGYQSELMKIKRRPSYGSLLGAIPTAWMMREAIKALETTNKYQPFYDRLAEMYRVDAPNNYVSPEECPPGAIACYIPDKKLIVSKEKTMSRLTAFHEWWHHLEHQGYVVRDKVAENREKNAREFARQCIDLMERIQL